MSFLEGNPDDVLYCLEVKDIALIAHARIDFDEGLSVLTGETGAGKTALLSACKLLVGERGDSSCVRDGAKKAVVEAVFIHNGKEIQVKRQIDIDGRSRCWLDGKAVNVADLARVVGPLLDLHGQHEHQSLLQPATHVAYLDAWAGEEAFAAKDAYARAFEEHAQARREYEGLVKAAHASKLDLDLARFDLSQIDAVGPQLGEKEALEAALPALQHADSLLEASSGVFDLLRGEEGITDKLALAASILAREGDIDPALDELAERLGEIHAQSEDIAMELRAYRDSLDFDPQTLEAKMLRVAALDGLCKKYGPGMDDVFARADEARRTLELADTGEDRIAAAQAELDAAAERLEAAAQALAEVRLEAADGFAVALTAAAQSLAMDSCSFVVAISDLPRAAWTAEGTQHIELLYSPGGSVTPRPLVKIASGGEISRVMLAITGEVDLRQSADTLVFDEVDAGIGGATAVQVAGRIRALAGRKQVISVTHLAQMAAVADRQLVVSKAMEGTMPTTSVREVSGKARIEEIARMLSGSIDEVSLAHARELLK